MSQLICGKGTEFMAEFLTLTESERWDELIHGAPDSEDKFALHNFSMEMCLNQSAGFYRRVMCAALRCRTLLL